MKLIILFLTFTISFSSFSKMNKLNFHRYAQPQLKNLTTEFFLVLKKLNENHVYYIDIQRSITKHLIKLKECDDLKYCAAIDRVALDLNHYESWLWTLQKMVLNKNSLNDEVDFDTIESSSSHAQKMIFLINDLKTELDLFLAINKNKRSTAMKHRIIQDLKQILILAQLGSTSLINPKYRDIFNYINENFILVIQQYILMQNDMNYLLSRFRELDNVWNSFHLKLDKEVQGFPKTSLNLIKIMHNRWNSVLKIILR